MRRTIPLLALCLALGACGSSDTIEKGETSKARPDTTEQPSLGGNGAPSGQGCLSPAEVHKQEQSIAEGIEGSEAEVEAKRHAIRALRARECR
jgi:hypothetical protein